MLDIRTRNMSGHQQVRNDQEIPSAISSSLGGWWVRPSNWASNTVIAIGGMATVLYGVWKISADREVCCPVPSTIATTVRSLTTFKKDRIVQPNRFIPSMLVRGNFLFIFR